MIKVGYLFLLLLINEALKMIGVCKKIYHEIVKLLTIILILGNAQRTMHLYIAEKEQFMAFCKITNSLTCKNRRKSKVSAINNKC